MTIAVLRIAGRANNKKVEEETLKRLNLNRKFACVLIDEKDKVKIGMLMAVSHMVSYGKVEEEFIKKLNKARKPEREKIFHMHPPIGGFKKSSKTFYPKGILGKHEDITKLLERMF